MARYQPSKPTLYINLEGSIVVPDASNPERAAIAPYGKKFMGWAVENFNVRWLTDRTPMEAAHVTRALGLPVDAVPYAGWLDSKEEAIDPKEDFYWIDGDLNLPEARWLAETDNAHRLLTVDPLTGVTSTHAKVLQAAVKTTYPRQAQKNLFRSR